MGPEDQRPPSRAPEAGPVSDPSILRIARSLPVLLRHLHADARAHALGGLHLDGSGAFALWLLNASGPLSAGELARLLRVSPAGVTAVVGRLVRGGYAQSAPDPDDRRRTQVGITPDGRLALREINGWWRRALGEICHLLPDEDVAALADILPRLALGLEGERGRRASPPQGAAGPRQP